MASPIPKPAASWAHVRSARGPARAGPVGQQSVGASACRAHGTELSAVRTGSAESSRTDRSPMGRQAREAPGGQADLGRQPIYRNFAFPSTPPWANRLAAQPGWKGLSIRPRPRADGIVRAENATCDPPRDRPHGQLGPPGPRLRQQRPPGPRYPYRADGSSVAKPAARPGNTRPRPPRGDRVRPPTNHVIIPCWTESSCAEGTVPKGRLWPRL